MYFDSLFGVSFLTQKKQGFVVVYLGRGIHRLYYLELMAMLHRGNDS